MSQIKKFEYKIYYKFLSSLALELTKFYNTKLSKSFRVSNKLKGRGYDPVTTSDKAFEKFIRSKISKKFPQHQIIGEELKKKNTNSDFTWVIDPIDGTRSYVIGNPSWSNLISINYRGKPMVGLANFPELNIRVAGAFHGSLSLKEQKKIPKILKLLEFPCIDALSYAHLAEGKIDVVIQCANKIWDIHPLIPIIRASGGFVSTWGDENAVTAGNIVASGSDSNRKKIISLLKPVRR